MRIVVPRTSITDILRKELFELLNKSLVVHQPILYALWARLGDLDTLPTDEHIWTSVITCGGGEEAIEGVCGGALTRPFTDFPSEGTSSELEAGEAGDPPAVGSEEEVAILPSGWERGSSSSKRRGKVDGGGDSESEAGARGNSPSFQQLTSPSNSFSTIVPGTRTEQSALMMRSAFDESFRQRCQHNINVLQASLMANHLVTKMQRFIAT